MAVFRYRAKDKNTEGHEESGTLVARDKQEAEQKLRKQGLRLLALKPMHGFSAFIARFTADIK